MRTLSNKNCNLLMNSYKEEKIRSKRGDITDYGQ